MSLPSQLLQVPAADPEDGRRRRLLNILLFGVGALILLMIPVTIAARAAGLVQEDYASTILRSSLIGLGVECSTTRAPDR